MHTVQPEMFQAFRERANQMAGKINIDKEIHAGILRLMRSKQYPAVPVFSCSGHSGKEAKFYIIFVTQDPAGAQAVYAMYAHLLSVFKPGLRRTCELHLLHLSNLTLVDPAQGTWYPCFSLEVRMPAKDKQEWKNLYVAFNTYCQATVA